MTRPGLRVLLTADAVGGVWQYAIDLARALGAWDIEPIVAVLGPAPTPDQQAGARGLRVIPTGLPLDWLCADAAPMLAAGAAIADLAASEEVDCVQLNMPTLGAWATFHVPVVAVTHGCVSTWWEAAQDIPLGSDYLWHRELMARGLRAADLVIAPTAAYGAIIARHYDLKQVPLTVHNGRPSQPVAPVPAMRDEVFTAGRLWDRVKNAGVLDRIAARLAVPFLAAGPIEGPHGETIRLDALRLLGTLSERSVAERLVPRPVFVSAARFEPFGLAVLEAASAGCALVLSDIPTFRELWDGVATFVQADDDRAFARAVDGIIGDRRRRGALGDAARERATRYTPAAKALAMTQIYQRLAPRQGTGSRVAA